MENELISFSTAKLAKEKGFDWEYIDLFNLNEDDYTLSYSYYDQIIEKRYYSKVNYNYDCFRISRPTQSLLQKWLRETHNIQMILKPYYNNSAQQKHSFICDVIRLSDGRVVKSHILDSYEEALEEGLINGLNLIK